MTTGAFLADPEAIAAFHAGGGLPAEPTPLPAMSLVGLVELERILVHGVLVPDPPDPSPALVVLPHNLVAALADLTEGDGATLSGQWADGAAMTDAGHTATTLRPQLKVLADLSRAALAGDVGVYVRFD